MQQGNARLAPIDSARKIKKREKAEQVEKESNETEEAEKKVELEHKDGARSPRRPAPTAKIKETVTPSLQCRHPD